MKEAIIPKMADFTGMTTEAARRSTGSPEGRP